MNTPKPIDEAQVIGILQKHTKQIANMLRQHFPPWSLFQAPGAGVNATGNRAVALTQNAPVVDDEIVPMVNGVATWTFSKTFPGAPTCTHSALGPYSGAATSPPEIYIGVAPTTQQVIFQSSQSDDTRLLHLHAVYTP